MTNPDDARGTTRRALLRNSALGVGALVGGAALVTAGATEAVAATSAEPILLTLDGVAHGTASKVRTVSWSLEEDYDTVSDQISSAIRPSAVVLTLAAGKVSPALLERVLTGHASPTGTIQVYTHNIQGIEKLTTKVTLTQVRVVSFHQEMTEGSPGDPGGLVDTVKLTYASLELLSEENNTEATYTVPTPPP